MPPRRKAPVAEKRRAPEAETTAPEAKKIVSPEAEGTPPICPLCLEWLEKDAQPMWVTPRGPNEPGPSSDGNPDLKSVVSLVCGHVFHKICITDCFEESIARDKTCPVLCPNCRQVIKNKNSLTKLHLSFESSDSAIKCSRQNCIKEKKQAEETIKAFEQASVLQIKRETDLKTVNRLLVLDNTRMQNKMEKALKQLEDEKKSWLEEKTNLERQNCISEDANKNLNAKICRVQADKQKLVDASKNLSEANQRLEEQHNKLMEAIHNLKDVSEDAAKENQKLKDHQLLLTEYAEMKRYYEKRIRWLNKRLNELDPHRWDGCEPVSD